MPEDQKDDYLAMAERAERAATAAASIVAKRSWREIAREYRALAARKLKLNRPDPKRDL